MKLFSILIFLELYICTTYGSDINAKTVSTYLSAKWPSLPLILETAEFMADESPATFWSFVNSVVGWDSKEYEKKNDEEKYKESLHISQKIFSKWRSQLLEMSLSLHVHAPKLELFRQIGIDRGLLGNNTCHSEITVDVNGMIVCDLEELKRVVEDPSTLEKEKPLVYDIDHRYPGSENNKIGIILYGELGTESFSQYHHVIMNWIRSGLVDYVFRPFVQNPGSNPLRISGYGVELAIKNTEYKAQDDTKLDLVDKKKEGSVHGFYFNILKERFPEKEESLTQLKKHIREISHELAPMKVWQLQHLSMQAAQQVLSSDVSPIEMLNSVAHVSQNFPKLARGLVQIKVDEQMKKEILRNQAYMKSKHNVYPETGAMYINGQKYELDNIDVFSLLDDLKTEQRAVEGLHNLGLKGDILQDILALDTTSSSDQSGSPLKYGLDIRDTAIVWLNDIENDRNYRGWSSRLGDLLMPSFPGMLRSLRRNLHNLVVILDPTSPSSKGILSTLNELLQHQIPLRAGLVFDVSGDRSLTGLTDAKVAVLCAFNYVVQSHDAEIANRKGVEFLLDLYSKLSDGITVESVTKYFSNRYKSEEIEDIFGQDSDFDVGRRVAADFVEKGRFSSVPQALFNGVPMEEAQLSNSEFEQAILLEVMKTTQLAQKAVYQGQLGDHNDVTDWLMTQSNIMPRLNERILSGKAGQFVDMSSTKSHSLDEVRGFDSLNELPLKDLTALVDSTCRYQTTNSENVIRPLTIWVMADFDGPQGVEQLQKAVQYTHDSNSVRVCGIHNGISEQPSVATRLILAVLNSLPPVQARAVLAAIVEKKELDAIQLDTIATVAPNVKGVDWNLLKSRIESNTIKLAQVHRAWSSRVAGLKNGVSAVLANGRLLGPFEKKEIFVQEDFALLERFTSSSLTQKITPILEDSESDPNRLSSLIMRVSGVLQTAPSSKKRSKIVFKATQRSTFTIPPKDPEGPVLSIIASVDPASAAAAKAAPLLAVFHEVLNCKITVFLNAVEKHSEMPLKSFYRLVLDPRPVFTGETRVLGSGPQAVFSSLPESALLTQNIQVPDNWMVEVVRSRYDLDNIKMGQVEGDVESEYELEHLLVEGHCFEASSGQPPRGLQFTLSTKTVDDVMDTIVMANLGYFQLKASPGAWLLRLRTGRSRDIYGISSHEGTDVAWKGDPQVLVSSFKSQVLKVRVAKQPGKEDVELLQDEDEEGGGGIWNTFKSTFGGASEDDNSDDDKTVNIFSVASGHLYERFLRIMMVSVRKQTSAPVKFWLLKNYLSPTLKDSLPALSSHYGFSYELVQYKWPQWLHQQTEKQRLIWGYKILFLDVLFPLHVKKIIFVDADQVVRADMKELHDLNLDGAPYGFVPFCDSRKEMDGFRFWNQGYWRNHLGTRKYHISALFVVDLKRFRRIAAGDRLRGQYQGLSQDPNSLSNLDQDLPNNMIHQVRIKSLPQDWLWCETWCDDRSKQSAKTIDLCNNPLTKESKLVAAERIISEWTEYDQDIKKVLSESKKSSKISHLEL